MKTDGFKRAGRCEWRPSGARLFGMVLLGIAAAGFPAQADVTVGYAPEMPTENTLASYYPGTTGYGLRWRADTTGSRDMGQSFLAASDGVMDSFSLRGSTGVAGTASGAPFTVNIYESTSESSIGSIVSTQSGNFLTGTTSYTGMWLTFDIENVDLTAGKYYTFMLSFDNHDMAAQEQVLNIFTVEPLYAGGRFWTSIDGAPLSSVSGWDLAFSVQRASNTSLFFSLVNLPPPRLIAYASTEEADAAKEALRTFANALIQASKIAPPSSFNSASECLAYQQGRRDLIEEYYGPFPPRNSLNPVIESVLHRDGYTIEVTTLEVRPGYFLPVNLYLPTNSAAPYPGVLFTTGHASEGDAAGSYQSFCINLAQKGYAVLSIDPMGQGEHREYFEPSLINYPVGQHSFPVRQNFLAGKTFGGLRTWDGIRALDYLMSLPGVDTNRIAATGNSGGGQMAMQIAAVDERIKVCAVGHPGGPGEVLSLKGETSLLLDLIPPRPCRIVYGVDSNEELAHQAKIDQMQKFYTALGCGAEYYGLVETTGGHNLAQEKRIPLYEWLNAWFSKEGEGTAESGLPVEAKENLWSTQSGSVVQELGSETARSLAYNFAQASYTPPADVPAVKAAVEEAIGLKFPEISSLLDSVSVLTTTASGAAVDVGWIQTEPGIEVPYFLALPPGQIETVFLYVSDKGKPALISDNPMIEELLLGGDAVLAIDVRGTGETAKGDSGPDLNRVAPFITCPWDNSEEYTAIKLFAQERQLTGMRVDDILRCVEWIKNQPSLASSHIRVIGEGEAGLWGLMATLFSPDIDKVICLNTVPSYFLLLNSEYYTEAGYFYLPGAIHGFDIPDLAWAVGPERQAWIDPVDASRANLTSMGQIENNTRLSGIGFVFDGVPPISELSLASVFSDHMVLQRERAVPVWGKAKSGAMITVNFAGQTKTTTANVDGKWSVDLDPMPVSTTPSVLTITDEAADFTLQVSDILVGEVWLCSGQSNMDVSMGWVPDGAAARAAANYPEIRLCITPHAFSNAPSETIDVSWSACTPASVVEFSAVAYYYGKKLYEELGVPIGLLQSSWGGSHIEPWIPPSGFDGIASLDDLRESIDPMPPLDGDPDVDRQFPTAMYNSMIHAHIPFAIRGAIWYQGESNHRDGMLYVDKTQALLNGWRGLWGTDFPFYFVQLAPFEYYGENPDILAEFWEAQAEIAKTIPNTGMAVVSDATILDDIHPTNKEVPGTRLALLALDHTYGQEIVSTGPTFSSIVNPPSGNTLEVVFDSAIGLTTRDGNSPDFFEVVGVDGLFKPAQAVIVGSSVIVSSSEVSDPVAMRFAWHKLATPNLMNAAGLPAAAFRAGDLPAESSLSVSYSSSVPTGNVLASYTPGSIAGGLGWRNLDTGSRELGQSFQATTNGVLDTFSLKTAGGVQSGSSSAAFFVTVYESTSNTSIGSVLSTQRGTYLASWAGLVSGDWLTFDIDNINLTAGNYYTCMLTWDDPGVAEKQQTFAVTTDNGYASPLWTSVDGAASSEYTNVDIPFVAQGPSSVVPSPLVVVSYTNSVPTNNVLASYTPGSIAGGLGWRNLAIGSRELGQSFQAPTNTVLDSFSLKTQGGIQWNASEATFVVTIYESATKTAIGSVVSTQPGTYLHRDENLISGDWVIFDIVDVNLTAGNYYTCMLTWDDPGVAEKQQTFAVTTNNGYDSPLWTAVDGAAYSEYVNVDIPFVAQVAP